jgi:hypothetical protein
MGNGRAFDFGSLDFGSLDFLILSRSFHLKCSTISWPWKGGVVVGDTIGFLHVHPCS